MACRNLFRVALLALATYLITCLTPSNPTLAQGRPEERSAAPARPEAHGAAQARPETRSAAQARPEARSALPARPEAHSAADDAAIKFRMNQWTVGLAAGLPDGGFVRFASEIARTMDDGDNMRLIPMVTRGTTTNIADLLYLKGVDVAITYADAFDLYSKQAGLADITDRIRYIMQFFISDIHIYARDEFKSLQDLKGQKVAVGTSGVAAALTGPLIFKRLGIDIQPVPVGGPVALEKLHKGEVVAMVYVAAKPSELFTGMKPEEGFHFVPVPYRKEFTDYYFPSKLKAEDYPTFLPAGTAIDTIAVPSVLAVYNWKPGSDRSERVNRFVEILFNNLSRLQKPPFHAKWRDVSLGAPVPGWKRYPYAQVVVERLKNADATASASRIPTDNSPVEYQRFYAFLATQRKAPATDAEKLQFYREYLEWSSRLPPK
jgi:TRAP-type uncharacterized transport system substrate-binding protein